MITEAEFLSALKTINDYKNQIEQMHSESFKNTGLKMKCGEWARSHDSISVRLVNILWGHHNDTLVQDLTKREFLSHRASGKKSWSEFCSLTGKSGC